MDLINTPTNILAQGGLLLVLEEIFVFLATCCSAFGVSIFQLALDNFCSTSFITGKHIMATFFHFLMPSVAVHRPGREPLIIERVIHVRALGPQHLIFYCVTFRTFRTDIRLFLRSSDWRPILAANSLFFMGCIFATVVENPPLQFYEPSLGPSSGAVSDSELSD